MLQTFYTVLKESFSYLADSKLLVAVSGGLDSVALAHLCRQAKLDFAIAHCNFQLRAEESDADEAFVAALAKQLKVPFHSIKFETETYAQEKKLSIQMAARQLRYNWFNEVLKENELSYVLTAHHADDALETFLINLSRGTGIEGLLGIPSKNKSIVRPLLSFSRDEILTYATSQKIEWREDSSNEDTKYLRNQLRHEVIPQLKSLNPQFLKNFGDTTQYLEGTLALAQKHIESVKAVVFNKKGTAYQMPIAYLKKIEPQAAYLYALLQPYGFTAWKDIQQLLDAQSGKEVFSKTHRLLKDRDYLYLQAIQPKSSKTYKIHGKISRLEEPIHLQLKKVGGMIDIRPRVAYIDKEKLKYPLMLRKWKPGDYFYPLGMQGKKKLKDYFLDEKYSLIDKEEQWLLCSEDAIVWVVGRRMDDRFKVTPETQNILEVKLL